MKDYGHLLRDDPEWARARGGVLARRCATSTSCWPSIEPRAARHPIAAARRLPRRLPPRPRAGRARRSRARCCARSPALELRRARRLGALLRLGRRLQPAQARGRGRARRSARRATCSPPARRRSPPPTPAARCRSRAHARAPAAGLHPLELLDRFDPRPRSRHEPSTSSPPCRPAHRAEIAHRRRARPSSAELHERFEPRRRELLDARAERRDALAAGGTLDFLHETREIREGDWQRRRRRRPTYAGPARRDHRPDGPQDGHQRAELGRERLHGRLRGLQLADLGQQCRRAR